MDTKMVELLAAAKEHLADIQDVEEDVHPETGKELDTVKRLRLAIEAFQ